MEQEPATPSNIPEDSLSSVFNDFFLDKIIKIRNDIGHDDIIYSFDEISGNICPDLPALLRVQNDILVELDTRNMVALVILDLSASFDTIYHTMLLRRLHRKFGIRGAVLTWITSYLCNRCQCIVVNDIPSDTASIMSFFVALYLNVFLLLSILLL